MVQSTAWSSNYPASNVLILGQRDAWINDKTNFWLAERGKTAGQGFTLKLGDCARIAGCQIKNLGKGYLRNMATKGFKISGSKKETDPWEILVEDELIDTSGGQHAALLSFTFEEPVEIQFIKFELVSYWGEGGGGLRYFAAIPATCEQSKYQTSMSRAQGQGSLAR